MPHELPAASTGGHPPAVAKVVGTSPPTVAAQRGWSTSNAAWSTSFVTHASGGSGKPFDARAASETGLITVRTRCSA